VDAFDIQRAVSLSSNVNMHERRNLFNELRELISNCSTDKEIGLTRFGDFILL